MATTSSRQVLLTLVGDTIRYMNERGGGGITTLMVLGLIILGCFWSYNHFIKADKWQIIYSNASDSYAMGEYSSSEACLEDLRKGNYPHGECGSNCKPRKTANVGTLYTCEETLD